MAQSKTAAGNIRGHQIERPRCVGPTFSPMRYCDQTGSLDGCDVNGHTRALEGGDYRWLRNSGVGRGASPKSEREVGGWCLTHCERVGGLRYLALANRLIDGCNVPSSMWRAAARASVLVLARSSS